MMRSAYRWMAKTTRRAFLGHVAAGAALAGAGCAKRLGTGRTSELAGPRTEGDAVNSVREFLQNAVVPREVIDMYLDPKEKNWAQFDPVMGYTLHDSVVQDGLDAAFTLGLYMEPHGQRLMVNYPDKPCRINTYGDSFTMCHQVSNGETWQEYLAAHIGEPIRNFGVGGYGVYQAYRRMLRTEQSEIGVPYVIFNVWGTDDHWRSIDSWRGLRCIQWFKQMESQKTNMFHSNPWAYLRVDPETGEVVEKENICPTPESLYNLCDEEFVVETWLDDPALNMFLATTQGIKIDTAPIAKLAEAMGMKLESDEPADIRKVYDACAMRASQYTITEAREFCEANGKKLLMLVSYAGGDVANGIEGRPRRDQPFIDFLKENGYRYNDAIENHKLDYEKYFKVSTDEYIDRYFIGHYSPVGNHFYAFAIKEDVIHWLDPKPPMYSKEGDMMRFDGYLP